MNPSTEELKTEIRRAIKLIVDKKGVNPPTSLELSYVLMELATDMLDKVVTFGAED